MQGLDGTIQSMNLAKNLRHCLNLIWMVGAFILGTSEFITPIYADLKITSFIQAEANYSTHFKNSNGESAGAGGGFSIPDAAIYLDGAVSGTQYFLDMPFGYRPNESHQNGLTPVNGLCFLCDKPQAYFGTSERDLGSTLYWTVGLFDSGFGFEPKDTKDIFFNRQSLLNEALPLSFLGTAIGLKVTEEFHLEAVLAEEKVRDLVSSTSIPSVGIRLNVDVDRFSIGLGGLFSPGKNRKRHGLINSVASLDLGSLVFVTEFDYFMFKDRDMGSGESQSAYSFFGQVVHKVTHDFTTVARGNFIKHSAFRGDHPSSFEFSIGPQYLIRSGLQLKFDYTFRMFNHDYESGTTSIDGLSSTSVASALSAETFNLFSDFESNRLSDLAPREHEVQLSLTVLL